MEEKIRDFFEKSLTENQIDNELYTTYSVKRDYVMKMEQEFQQG